VERLGVMLEPEEPYELNSQTGGGVEDPRVTYLAALGAYVMTYSAYGEAGPRLAAAISRDLVHWRRLGLLRFAPHHGVDVGILDNKDAVLFPEPVSRISRFVLAGVLRRLDDHGPRRRQRDTARAQPAGCASPSPASLAPPSSYGELSSGSVPRSVQNR
jgi:hypothetical protein